MIERGARFTISSGAASGVVEVKTIRYRPAPYAEVEPIGGGRRLAVTLAMLERCSTPTPVHNVAQRRTLGQHSTRKGVVAPVATDGSDPPPSDLAVRSSR